MVYGDLQFFDIIVFAAIAVFLIYRLRSVLGKRTGHEKQTNINKTTIKNYENENKKTPQLKDNELKLKIIYDEINDFDHKQFFDGAKKAFEIIITAFNQGDTKTLRPLVSKDVFTAFANAITEKQNDPSLQFYSLIIEGVEDAKIETGFLSITVKFVSEQFKGNDESKIIKKQDIWTFKKKIDSKDPSWVLTSTNY